MSDLISREAVIEALKQSSLIDDDELGNLIIDEISRVPTAYDVDKVMNKLEDAYDRIYVGSDEKLGAKRGISLAITIVKAGGKE